MKLLKLYRLARSPFTQHDLEMSNIAQFLLLCPALFYSALGHHEKVEGHSKKFFPALRAGNCAPPLLNCFRRH